MAQPVNPPDGWTPTAGLWGTDFQRDTSLYLTSGSSLKVVGTAANNQTIVGPWVPIDGNGVAYDLTAVLRATNNTSLMTLRFEIYAGDKATILQTVYLMNNQAVPTANTWMTPSAEFTSAANYSWGRFVLSRASGATSSINLDRVESKKLGPRWGCFKSDTAGNQVFGVTASYVPITFDTTDYKSLVDTSTSNVTIYRAGLYLLYLRVRVTLSGGSAFNLKFEANDPVYGLITIGTAQYTQGLVVHTSLYRHTGTLGGGTTITASILAAAGATIHATPPGLSSNGNTYETGWTGAWLGLG